MKVLLSGSLWRVILTGERSPIIILKKDGHEISADRYEVTLNEVMIPHITIQDKGVYSISCQSKAGEGFTTFTLDVTPAKGIILHSMNVAMLC